jgi:hypothetical protein
MGIIWGLVLGIIAANLDIYKYYMYIYISIYMMQIEKLRDAYHIFSENY